MSTLTRLWRANDLRDTVMNARARDGFKQIVGPGVNVADYREDDGFITGRIIIDGAEYRVSVNVTLTNHPGERP